MNKGAAAGFDFAGGGVTEFFGNTSAANGAFTNEGRESTNSLFGGGSGVTAFLENSTAGNGIFTNNGGPVSGALGGATSFYGISTAANAIFTSDGGAVSGAKGSSTYFGETSTAGNSTLTANGGVGEGGMVLFDVDSNGGTGGSPTKIGTGTLTLSGANSYTSGTSINGGSLVAITNGAFATGIGSVQVNAGTLGGTSKLSGAIILGTGTGSGAFVAPGVNGPGTLTTQRTLTFNSDSAYNCEVDTKKKKSDQVAAKGVNIDSGTLSPSSALEIVQSQQGPFSP